MEYDEVYCTLYNLLIPIQVKNQTAMKTKNTIEKERMIEAEVTQVWDVLTSPVYIEQWLGTKTQSKWKKGSPITFSFSWDGRDFIDKGEIVVFEKNKTFSYTYWSSLSGLPDAEDNYSKVTFDLQPEGNATKLMLTHTDFATETMYEHSNENWKSTLDKIKQVAENE